MSQAIRFQNHPFRFLLYLEWGLLAMAIISALESPPGRLIKRAGRESFRLGRPPLGGAEAHSLSWHYSPILAVVSLVLFSVMGLYLPAGRLAKLGHTLGQILLVLLASVTIANDGRTFPFIYLVLVIRGCLMFSLPGRIVLAGTAFVLFLSGLLFRLRLLFGLGGRLPPQVRDRFQMLVMGLQLNFIVLFALSLLLLVLLINALLTERQSQSSLQQANENLRRSAKEIETLAMDQERSRIARDIHDSLGHSLTALNVQLESAVKLWERDPPRSQQFLHNAKRLGTQSLQEVRQSVAALRQDPLGGKTLETAIAYLIQDIQSDPSNQLAISQQIELADALPDNLKVLLYRIVQEGLTNVVKHANAKRVCLQLIGSQTIVTLSLEDDGEGFEIQKARAGFGLQSMRDRAESVGGTFVVNSNRQGTRLQVSLPIESRFLSK
ncbi:MAG: sensor histidine kinase [Cyanobacteria bacterium P01_D01_bin.1]